MLMVVFGAGASYDSAPSRQPMVPDFPERLPLADQLFDDRPHFQAAIARYPDCQAVITRLRHRPADMSVEQVLEGLRAEAEQHPARHRQLAAIRWYLHTMIWDCELQWNQVVQGTTNYKTLLDEIERVRKGESVALVTFNYDRMLEEALPTVGLTIRTMSDYITSDYKIIKLHGSINWAREVNTRIRVALNLPSNQIAPELIRTARDLDISQRYRIIDEREYPIGRDNSATVALFPAIAIPFQNKEDYECPPEHLDVLRDFIPRTTGLLIIGWRAKEQHFLRLLRENLPNKLTAFIVAGSDNGATAVKDDLERAGVIKSWNLAGAGFSNFLIHRRVDRFWT